MFMFLTVLNYLPFLGFINCSNFHSREHEKTFVDALLNKTLKHSAPFDSELSAVNEVRFVVELFQLMDIDERRNLAKMRIWLEESYSIPALAWDPEDYGGLELIQLAPLSVWTPDIVFREVSSIEHDANTQQGIYQDGTVTSRSTVLTLNTFCPVNIIKFPFDTQECTISAGQWMSSNRSYVLSGYYEGQREAGRARDSLAEDSGQWKIEGPATYSVFTLKYEGDENYYSRIQYKYRFKRDYMFYLMVLVVPSMMLGCLPLLTFLLPFEFGEKISLGLTVLLAQVVELLVLSDIIPPTSKANFPELGKFVISLIILISLSIVESVVVTAVYSLTPQTKVPALLRILLRSKNTNEDPMIDHVITRGKESRSRESNPGTLELEAMRENETDNKESNPEKENECKLIQNDWHSLAKLIDKAMFVTYAAMLVVVFGKFYIALKSD